ncbi:MAG: hypothetical protein ACLQBQ_08115 [Smithella sp.]
MSNPSSTSSSNPVGKKPQTVKVALLTFIILLCVGLSLSIFRGSLEKIVGKSRLTPIFSYLEFHDPYDSQVIFLGSSHFVSGIKSDFFAKLSGMEPAKVLNLAADSEGSWEELLLGRKYPSMFHASPLVIIEVSPSMFNKNAIHPVYKTPYTFEPHFYTWATLQERFEYPDLMLKLLLISDYVWPISERRSLYDWISVIQSIVNNRYVEPHLSVPLYQYDVGFVQSIANNPNFFAQNIAQNQLNNYEFANHKAEYLKRLIHLAEKKSTKKIILLQTPVRKEYMDVIYNNPKYAETYTQYLRFIHSLENENVHAIIWETPKDCGLNDSVFIDYGHFNILGAYNFTQRLFIEMKNRGIIVSHKNGGME